MSLYNIYVSLLVAVIGAWLYIRSVHPKRVELGRIAFGCGLLAFLLQIASAHLGFGAVPK